MKKLFFCLLLTTAVAALSTSCRNGKPIHEDMTLAFPDPVFRQYVLDNFDTDKNGMISAKEAAAVTEIDVSGTDSENNGITSLKGIEYFANLTELSCFCNKITSLDVSENAKLKGLACHKNQLTSLDVTKNTNLTSLWCSGNQLTELDLSRNTELLILWCFNNSLTNLDLSKNTNLSSLWCSGNQLTELDLSKTDLNTDLFSSTQQPQLLCTMPTLKKLYLKKGWSIEGITENRSSDCIFDVTEIVFVD